MVAGDPLELVARAVENPTLFKQVAAELGRLPPDRAAADALATAYRTGEAPAWLTAFLLGCIGYDGSYGQVLEILLSASGSLATSYAGPAAAKIAGPAAFRDLSEFVLHAERLSSREGAAFGLGDLRSEKAVPVLLEAARAGAVRCATAASILVRLPLALGQVVELLQSSDIDMVRLGTEIVWQAVSSAEAFQYGWFSTDQGRLAVEVRHALSIHGFTMKPSKRHALAEWVAKQTAD